MGDISLAGRVALVTGASQGIGEGCAMALARAGANLMLAQRQTEAGERVARRLRDQFGVQAASITVDVTKAEDIERMIASTMERYGRLDILVNNAGRSFVKRLENHTDAEMADFFELNYFSVFRAMRAAFPIMKVQGYGRIINMGSLNGVNAHMFTASYNASKEAMRALSRTAAVEWGPHGISVNVICPSSTSPRVDKFMAGNPAMWAEMKKQIPMSRMGDPEGDIGPVVVFLASEASGFTTGNTFFVDGGSHVNGVAWRPQVDD